MKNIPFSMGEMRFVDWKKGHQHLDKKFKDNKNYQRVLKHRIRQKTLYVLRSVTTLFETGILTKSDLNDFDFLLNKKVIEKLVKVQP